MTSLRLPLLACLTAAMLSGCTANLAKAEGTLVYNGASSGTDDSSFDCDGSAEISAGMNIGQGTVKVAIKDAAGKTLWSKTYSGPANAADNTHVTGTSGVWTLEAHRTSGSWGPFSGNYAISVDC